MVNGFNLMFVYFLFLSNSTLVWYRDILKNNKFSRTISIQNSSLCVCGGKKAVSYIQHLLTIGNMINVLIFYIVISFVFLLCAYFSIQLVNYKFFFSNILCYLYTYILVCYCDLGQEKHREDNCLVSSRWQKGIVVMLRS